MNVHAISEKKTVSAFPGSLALCLCLMVASPALWADDTNGYTRHNLVSDGFVQADHTDPNLKNPWGLVFNPRSFVWLSDTGSGVSTLYNSSGNPESLVVKIPGGSPTGIVYNHSSGFVVSEGGTSGPSSFIFATEHGRISGWNYNVDAANAITMVDNAGKTRAVYKGLAIVDAGGAAPMLYATDFHNGRIDMFDKDFHAVHLSSGKFTDPRLPAQFAPFGIQNIDGDLYITYAKQDAAKHDDVHGSGLGFVDVYSPSGELKRRLISRGNLNAPWGLAKAPADFGKFSNSLLVANFGDGTINAYNIADGKFKGQLMTAKHRPLVIKGLWGIGFGNGKPNQPTNALFFAAGPDHEKHGVYGRIEAAMHPQAGGQAPWTGGSSGY
jgi:uncharacterized protein (TIGR03118 family)